MKQPVDAPALPVLPPPPFSRLHGVNGLGSQPETLTIMASASERAALAKENDLPALDELRVEVSLVREGPVLVRFDGVLHARLTRLCIVSLEPFETRLKEPFSVWFAPESEAVETARRAGGVAPADSDEEDIAGHEPPDAIIDGQIDLGRVAGEYLTLALDPWPRKPGVEFTPPADVAPQTSSPFGALAHLGSAGKKDKD